MKSSDLPILQFFTKRTTSNTDDSSNHEILEDLIDDEQVETTEPSNTVEQESIYDDSQSCPVCQKLLLGDNDKINQHIDLCLNGEIVRSTIREEDQRHSPQMTQKKR